MRRKYEAAANSDNMPISSSTALLLNKLRDMHWENMHNER
jgi:hypothetical protein